MDGEGDPDPMTGRGQPWFAHLWDRNLHRYPDPRARYGYLAVVVLTTIVLYYQQYVGGAVAPSVLAHFDMSFRFYLTVIVVSSVAGAVASLLAGLADRWGRANMVVWGLLVASTITAFGIPNASSSMVYGVLVAGVGFIEGMVLVATPALVRDFSPQVKRGAAMGFWVLGPVVGSLVVSEVASNTLAHLHPWQDQFHIAGITGFAMFVVAFPTLRELSPPLRDQIMVSSRERVLIEARARGIDVAAAVRHPWRQMATVRVVVPALGVSVFLLIYYAAVGFFVIYFSSVFGYSQAQANGLGNWFWAANAVAVVAVGIVSDRVGVRKPFMVVGGAAAVVMAAIFASRATHPATAYSSFIVIVSILSVSRGIAYAPWMAAFTETVEERNPALVATGLAVWGWILRVVAALSFLVLPYVVTSVSPVVDYGTQVKAITVRYAPQVTTLAALDPATLAALQKNIGDRAAIAAASSQIVARLHTTPLGALQRLLALRSMPRSVREYLAAHGPQVRAAQQEAPAQWERWWWVCVAGEVLFLPTIFFLVGRWLPATARRDAEEHRRMVDAEEAHLSDRPAGAVVPTPTA